MDAPTRAIYEARADEWVARRHPRDLDKATAWAADRHGPSIDLGCGPGWYAAALPRPVIALDGARSMLQLARAHALVLQADLTALPIRRGALASAWARNSYVHLPRTSVPLAMADLHGAMQVDGQLSLQVFAGEGEGRDVFVDDDFPGRFFSTWAVDHLGDVVRGAGFVIDDLQTTGDAITVHATRARTLPDLVRPGLRLVLCGLNPSLHAADAGVGFVSPSNRFWPAARAAGILTNDRDPWHAVREHGVGFTDLVKRASVGAAEVKVAEYRDGFARVERLVAWLEPRAICFVGLAGYRAAVDKKAVVGWQARTVGGRPAYVMPNPSGLNARATVDILAAHLRAAFSAPQRS
ncbi:MAG: double-stranded uracil-DNA glycosylase [Acidimicrobiaceae bacterium]